MLDSFEGRNKTEHRCGEERGIQPRSRSSPVIGELHRETMILSSQLLNMLRELVLSAKKSQVTAPAGPASSS